MTLPPATSFAPLACTPQPLTTSTLARPHPSSRPRVPTRALSRALSLSLHLLTNARSIVTYDAGADEADVELDGARLRVNTQLLGSFDAEVGRLYQFIGEFDEDSEVRGRDGCVWWWGGGVCDGVGDVGG